MVRRYLVPMFSLIAVFLFMSVTATAVRADPRDFTLHNFTGSTIYYVYVSSSDTTDWEEDLLGSDVLLNGSSVNITFSTFRPGRCNYDIKVVTSDNREGFLWAVDLCSTTTVTFR